MPLRRAVAVAWEAGAVYVQRKHNRPVSPQDLLAHVDPIAAKFVTNDWLRDRDFELTFTNGCFDIIHSGHLELLKYCKSIGNKVVVAVNSDESVKVLKGCDRPINTLAHRMQMLAQLSCVDYVVSFEEETPEEILGDISPNILVKGGDYCPDDVVGKDLVEEVRIFPLMADQSTTHLIEKIKSL
jgi:D-beta-D-heptose 7-phosphate kinase/D-beta-D-heptose 1-phosphate adenosyltransferase